MSITSFYLFFLLLAILLFLKYQVKNNEAFRKKLVLKLKNISIVFFMPYWALITASLILFYIYGRVLSPDLSSKDLSSETASSCGCSVPSISIPSYANSWEDKIENWSYKECAIAQSNEVTEKIHVYVFYNSKINIYRCELRYSWPGNDCRMSSKLFGMNATSTADISGSTYQSGEWKSYNYWFLRNQ